MTDAPSTLAARILVCGGRTYANRDYLFAVLDRFHTMPGVALIVHGAATGADTLAGEWAAARGVPVQAFPAAWQTFGRIAGQVRNARMLRETEPHLVVAFPGGAGTADMVRRAEKAGVRVCDLRLSGPVAGSA